MEERIKEIITEIVRIDRDTLDANIDSKEIWNSLQRVEVLFAVEDEFGIQFSEDALVKLYTPLKLCQAAEQEV